MFYSFLVAFILLAAGTNGIPSRPYQINGTITISGQNFNFVSGGRGWSIPYGTYLITPDEVGKWGSRHHAIGLNHDDGIYDPVLKRMREGVEMHAAIDGHTGGCIGILSHYRVFRRLVLKLCGKGQAWLHVNPDKVEINGSSAG